MTEIPFIIRILLSGWSIGLGFRFFYEYIRGSGQPVWYQLVPFDVLFDWLGLMVLGIMSYAVLHDDIRRSVGKNKEAEEFRINE